MKSLNDPLEIIFVVLNFVARFRVPNVDSAGFSPEGYGIRACYALQAGYVIRATPSCWHATP